MHHPIQDSKFFDCPEKFLQFGQRVRAITRVYDLPGQEDPGPIHAEAGECGQVVHVQEGFWPTVKFDRTGSLTCVTDLEVEPVEAGYRRVLVEFVTWFNQAGADCYDLLDDDGVKGLLELAKSVGVDYTEAA